MKDCAFDKSGYCTILRKKGCEGCSFKKTKEELIEGRQRAMERINALPNPKKYYIVHKYHEQWR